MKKFGRKLFLSCAALAACATTLVSTTFAWYTSNTEVTAGSLSALSSSTVDTSSFYIAAATKYDGKNVSEVSAYGPSANPTPVAGFKKDAENKDTTNPNTTFEPVYYNLTDGTYKQLSGATAAEGSTDKTIPTYSAESNANILEFVYRFRITNPGTGVNDVPVYFKTFTVENTVTGALPTQKANTAGLASDITGISTAGQDYAVDILKAMKMNVTITKMTNETTLATGDNISTFAVYGLTNYVTKAHADVNIATSGANALGFYNGIMKTKLSTPSTTDYNVGTELSVGKSSDPFFYIPGDTGYVEVRFAFYLDGWDSYCYDVCRQQGIKVVMDFTSASASAAATISGYAAATQWNTPSQS